MKSLNRWVHAHPFKAVLFTFVFTLIAACAAASGLRDIGAFIFSMVVLLWVFVFLRDGRRLLPLLLAGSLLASPTQANQEPRSAVVGGVIVGTVVIVAGGYICYKLVKFCQKHFSPPPEDTNAPPAELTFNLDGAPGGGGSFGAAQSASPLGSCYDAAGFAPLAVQAGPDETAFKITAVVNQDGTASLAGFGIEPGQVSFTDWRASLGTIGLAYSDGGGLTTYSRDGATCSAAESPIVFNADGSVTVDLGGPLHHIIVERTADLQTWTTVLSTWLPASIPVVITDTSSDSASFYRVRAE